MYKITFKINNEYNNFLCEIFNGISFDNSKWAVFDDEVYDKDDSFLFSKESYSADEFKKIITNKKYYIVFLGLKMYDINDDIDSIKDYEDFCYSNCKLILFVTDCEFVELYVKENDVANTILSNAKSYNYANIVIDNNLENVRNCFSAYTD